jgi:predicted HicB family RNase H-like nuclease
LSCYFRYSNGMAKTTEKRRGRPPKRSEEKKGDYLDVRLEPAEKQAFKAAADLAGLPLSTWVRERLRRVSRHELEEANMRVPFLPSPY